MTAEDSKDIEGVEGYATANQAEVGLLTSVLENEGVQFRFLDQFTSAVRPFAIPARSLVAREDVKRVQSLIEEMQQTGE